MAYSESLEIPLLYHKCAMHGTLMIHIVPFVKQMV